MVSQHDPCMKLKTVTMPHLRQTCELQNTLNKVYCEQIYSAGNEHEVSQTSPAQHMNSSRHQVCKQSLQGPSQTNARQQALKPWLRYPSFLTHQEQLRRFLAGQTAAPALDYQNASLVPQLPPREKGQSWFAGACLGQRGFQWALEREQTTSHEKNPACSGLAPELQANALN